MSRFTATCSLALIALLAAPASADILLLKDGRVFDGRPMSRTLGGIQVQFENGTVLVPDDLIQDAVLENDKPAEPTTDEERAQIEKGRVKFEGRWVTPKYRDELIRKKIERRREEIEEIRVRSEWRNRGKETTKHFEFEYTVPPHIHEYYRDLLEAFYVVFKKTWNVKPFREQKRLPVMCHGNARLFHRNSGAPGGALAYYKFVHEPNEPRRIEFFYNRIDPLQTERAMYHEATHYLVDLLRHEFKMPHFPGESLAEYYGGSEFNSRTKKLTTGLVQESRLAQIKLEILTEKMLGLEKMILTDGMYQHYSWGWTLVHYCMNDKKRKKSFEKYVKMLVSGRGCQHVPMSFRGLVTVRPKENWKAFRTAFGLKTDEKVKAFEKAWHDYVKKELEVVTPKGLGQAARDAERNNMPIRAKRLYKEAIDGGSKDPLTFYSYGRVLERNGKRSQAIEMFSKAIALDPMGAAYYAALGKALAKVGKTAEGKKKLALAAELDPNIDTDLD